MHLNSGSGWNMRKGRRGSNPWRIFVLLALIGGMLYVNQFVIPKVSPVGVPTPTPTRSPVSYAEEAKAFFATGKLQRALDAYRLAIEADPVNLTYHVELARIQIYSGDIEGALESAENAVLINPDSALAHATRGRALTLLPDRGTDAEAALAKALQIDPGLAVAHAYHAELLSDNQRWSDAADEARQALSIDPSSLEGHLALAYVYESTGNYADALTEYQKAQAINPNLAVIYLSMGNNSRAAGDPDAAINLYQKAIALDPNDPTPYSLIAQTYGAVGEYGKASQYAEQALELDPSNPRLHGLLGRMYYHNNEFDKSLPEFELATRGGKSAGGLDVTGLPLEPGIVAEYYYTYGLALVKQEKCSLARPIFDLILAAITEDQDDIAVFNAQEGIRLCRELEAAQATPAVTPTP